MIRVTPAVSMLVSLTTTAFVVSLVALGCATTEPSVQKVDARPLQPTAGEEVVVDHLLVIVDSSGSLDDGAMFYEERALVESFVASSPDGNYEAGAVAFGGFDRAEIPMAAFDRAEFQAANAQTPYLESGTPLHKVLSESTSHLGGRSGRAAVVIFSDGVVTDEFGRSVEEERIVASATELSESYDGTVCFHTVQVGESVEGARLLARVSEVTACGTARPASAAGSESQLHAMHREVFIGARQQARAPALPPVAAAPPATPAAEGRFSVNFGFDSAQVDSRYDDQMGQVAAQLQADPEARVRIQGHTDTKGNVDYNRKLSMRRAEATRDALVSAGADAGRIDVEGFGEDAPLFADDSAVGNSAANRRTDIEIVR